MHLTIRQMIGCLNKQIDGCSLVPTKDKLIAIRTHLQESKRARFILRSLADNADHMDHQEIIDEIKEALEILNH
jgi:hypothetical protein